MRARTGFVSLGEIVAAFGAALLLGSLWRPWYDLRFPEEVLSQARAFSARMGELAPFANQGIDELQARGSIPVTAWQAFEQADAALAIAAGLTIGLVVLNVIGALSARLDGLIALTGVVATAVVGYRLLNPPGSDLPFTADLLHPTTALYAALGGAMLMLVGGLMALSAAEPAPATAPAAPAPVGRGDVRVWDAS